jgi:WD40 repeat protein/transcriptional regulator with XRE-family HTH domain
MNSSTALRPVYSFDSFGDLLKYLRRRARLTQLELSIAVGYSESQITRLEKNQRLPDLTAIKALFIPALNLQDDPQLAAQFLEFAQSARQEDAPVPGIPPYKGLLFFEEEDADLFFGRETLTARLAEHVIGLAMDSSSRFLAVVGASGSGKSSLVRAGLAVALKRVGWDTRIFTPTANPLQQLEANLNSKHRNAAERVLILVDQFEEVFTLCRDEMQRIAFIEKLLISAQEKSKTSTVAIALRADFYSHCAQYPLLRQAVAAEQEYIGQMTAEELRRAIEGPAKRGGWEFEPGLVDVLLNDIGAKGTSEPEPGALPLLSHALLATWERRRGRMFTLESYHASGGVRGAIAETAESVFNDQLNQTQQELARNVFLRLTKLGEGTEDTRRRAALNELVRQSAEATQLRSVLNILAEARLITLNEDSAEVAHEALIREWQRLHEWLTQDRDSLFLHRHLTESAHEWGIRGRDPSELYRGVRLAQAGEWASANEERLNAEEQVFLAASIQQEEHEALEREAQRQRELASAKELADTQRQATTRLRLRNRVISAMGLVAFVLAIFAITFGLQSKRNAQTAQYAQTTAQAANTQVLANFTRSEAQRLAAESINLFNGDPGNAELSALLSVRSMTMLYTPSGDAALSRASLMSPKPRQFTGHTDLIYGIAFSPDGRFVATASTDTTIRLWDLANGETTRIFSGHSDDVGGVTFSPDGKYIATASFDRTARVWDVATGETVQIFQHPARLEFGPAFSPDGKYLLTGCNDESARLWEVATGKLIHEFVGHSKPVYGVEFSPDGETIATASGDRTARLWDVSTGEQLQVLEGHEAGVDFTQFSPDGRTVATSGDDHSIRLWEVASGEQVRLLAGHQDWVQALAFSPDGKYLLSGSNDRTARLWDVQIGQLLHTFNHPQVVESVAFSPNGAYIATGGNDKIARVWNLQSGLWDMQLKSHTSAVNYASFSSDGDRILTASDDGTVKLWNATTGQVIQEFIGHTSAVKSAIFSPDGKTVLTTSWDQTARLWDPSTGKQVRLFKGHTGPILRAAFSPDGTYIVTASFDGTARVWDTKTAKTILIYDKQGPAHINRVAFSPDGKTVVTSGDEGTARIWDPRSGKELMVFKGHGSFVTGIAFSPDGKFLLTSSFDGSSRLWDVATGKELHRFLGHQGEVYGATFSPDGKYVATSGADGTIRLWAVATGVEVRRFAGHTNIVSNVVFSPDAKFLLTASNDTTARLWFTDYHDIIHYVCSLLSRDFTDEERLEYGISDHNPTCPAQ